MARPLKQISVYLGKGPASEVTSYHSGNNGQVILYSIICL